VIERQKLEDALRLARERLLAARLGDGYWEGRLCSSALATATAISALALAGEPQDEAIVARGIRWLEATQNADGGWGDTPDSPSNLATSLLAVSALRIAADIAQSDSALAKANRYVSGMAGEGPSERVAGIKAAYGSDRTFAVPILVNCALAGLVPWDGIPALPFELAALPQGLYRFAGLSVVSYALPALIAVGLALDHFTPPTGPLVRLIRRLVNTGIRRKLEALQPEHGGFLEATPLTAFVAMSITAAYGAQEPVVRKCLEFLRASVRADGSWPIDTNLSVWVTTAALNALAKSGGLSPDEVERTCAWIRTGQYGHVHPFTGARPGGWGWTHLAGGVPDADDTSAAILALVKTGDMAAVPAGVTWLARLQNPDGGWPTFCRGWGRLPFDRSCPDITAHALRALHAAASMEPLPELVTCVARGMRYLLRQQQADGSWLPLWFGNQAAPGRANPVLGTARVLMALAEWDPTGDLATRGLEHLGDMESQDAAPAASRRIAAWTRTGAGGLPFVLRRGPQLRTALAEAITYLGQAQNPDGGWGGAAGVASSVEETALAVSALSAWPQETRQSLTNGVSYLLTRIENGTWTQATPIGVYFARLWYSEELYPVIWTVEALGRALRASEQLGS